MTLLAVTGAACCGWGPEDPGPNQPGVPGAGKGAVGVPLPECTAMGWSGGGYGAPDLGGAPPGAAAVPTGWLVGEAQCTAPQAESVVIVLATTVNGFSGSRRSSRGAGTNVASGITGVDG